MLLGPQTARTKLPTRLLKGNLPTSSFLLASFANPIQNVKKYFTVEKQQDEAD